MARGCHPCADRDRQIPDDDYSPPCFEFSGDNGGAVDAGRIVGIIGHNGAGKTTLFDLVSGFQTANSGCVLLDGVDVARSAPHRRAVQGLGRSFQEARLFPSLTVADTLRVALERHLANRDPVAAGLRLPASADSESQATGRVDELVELLGLATYRDRLTSELSTGTRRIVELGVLLAHDPAVVLLDEPSAGIAPTGDRGAGTIAPPGTGRDWLFHGRDRARHQSVDRVVRRVRGDGARRGDRSGVA